MKKSACPSQKGFIPLTFGLKAKSEGATASGVHKSQTTSIDPEDKIEDLSIVSLSPEIVNPIASYGNVPRRMAFSLQSKATANIPSKSCVPTKSTIQQKGPVLVNNILIANL